MLYKVVFSTADYILMFFVRKLSDFLIFIFFILWEEGKRKIQRKREDPPRSLDRAFLLSCISGDVVSTLLFKYKEKLIFQEDKILYCRRSTVIVG